MALKICFKTTSIYFIRLSNSLFCEYVFRIIMFVGQLFSLMIFNSFLLKTWHEWVIKQRLIKFYLVMNPESISHDKLFNMFSEVQ